MDAACKERSMTGKAVGRSRSAPPGLLSLFLLLILSGCASRPPGFTQPERGIPDYRLANGAAVYSLPADLLRVVVMPVYGAHTDPGFLDGLDQTLIAALNQKGLFEVVPLDRSWVREETGQPQHASTSNLPADLFTAIREEHRADGLILVDLLYMQPYRPVALGLRARLIDLNTGRTLWAVDEVFDSGNPQVAVSAQRFHRSYADSPYPLDNSASILQSPRRFSGYVAWEFFNTLPPRTLASDDPAGP